MKRKIILKTCKKHGKTDFVILISGASSCKKCLVESSIKCRQKLKLKAIEYKGGKCSYCGYNKSVKALQFHHLDSNKKDFTISNNGATKSWNKIKNELDKCILVCANCHAEIHDNIL